MRLLAALLLGLLLLAPGARAGERRVALVVGNGAYRNVDPLRNPASDARLMAQTLQALGFELVGGGAQTDLDRAGLAKAVEAFGHALAGAQVGLFYYSGHGLQVGGTNWLVPVDANPTRPQDLDFQMVDADLVLRQMDGAGTKLNLVLLDACRNNPFATRGLRSMQAGLAEMRAPEGTLISYATQPGNVAADGDGKDSPYTLALTDSMRKPGLDVFRVFNQVGLAVKRETAGAQQPWVSNSPIDGDFFFVPPPAAAPPPPAPPPAAPPAPDVTLAGGRCSRVLTRRDGARVETVRLSAGEAEASRAIRPVAERAIRLPAFACGLVEAAGEAVLRNAVAPQPLAVAAAGGARARLTVSGAAGRAVRLDLLLADGTVQHVPDAAVGQAAVERLAGAAVLLAIASAAPLPLGERPPREATEPYFAALQPLLDGADAAVVAVEPAPPPPRPPAPARATPVAAPAPKRPAGGGGGCAAILERAQLGEPLSDAETSRLRANCR